MLRSIALVLLSCLYAAVAAAEGIQPVEQEQSALSYNLSDFSGTYHGKTPGLFSENCSVTITAASVQVKKGDKLDGGGQPNWTPVTGTRDGSTVSFAVPTGDDYSIALTLTLNPDNTVKMVEFTSKDWDVPIPQIHRWKCSSLTES